MITLSAQITGLIVTTSMGLFLAGVAILCVLPLIQAVVERRRPDLPDLPAVFENLGIALAMAGFTFRVTEIAAAGVVLALVGAAYGAVRKVGGGRGGESAALHPLLEKAMLVCGLVSLGVLGEYYYILS